MTDTRVESDEERRQRAIDRLKKRRDFHADLFAYIVVNTFVVIIWAMTGTGFFWPIFLILAWGVGVIFHARDTYWGDEPSEERIRREMQHLH